MPLWHGYTIYSHIARGYAAYCYLFCAFHSKEKAYLFGCRTVAPLCDVIHPAPINSSTCRHSERALMPYFLAAESGNIKSRRPPLSIDIASYNQRAPADSFWKSFDSIRELPICMNLRSRQSGRAESQPLSGSPRLVLLTSPHRLYAASQ